MSMAKKGITKEDVKHVSQLSSISLTEAEVDRLSKMLTTTLDYIDVLEELDTSKTEETHQVTGLINVYQKVNESPTTLSQKDALSGSTNSKNNLFVTKVVLQQH